MRPLQSVVCHTCHWLGRYCMMSGSVEFTTYSTLQPYTCTEYIFLYHGVYVYHPLSRFSVVDISTVGMVLVPKSWALETSHRVLSENVSFGIGTLLVVEQSSLENRRPREV